MKQIQPFRLGILPVMIDLYNRMRGDECRQLKEAAMKAAVALGSETLDVSVGELVATEQQVRSVCEKLLREGIDLLIVGHVAYAPSGELADALVDVDAPVLLWPIQPMLELKPDAYDDDAVFLNHGVHGTQDLANVLRRRGRPFGLLHGHYQQADFCKELLEWARAARAIRAMQSANPVQVGGHFENMLDLQIGQATFPKLKPHVVSLDQFARRMEAVGERGVAETIEQYRLAYDISPDMNEAILAKSARGEIALRQILEEKKSRAVGINFLTLCNDKRIADGLHVAASRLMVEGCGYGGEGDWATAVMGLGMSQAFVESSFTEIFSVGYEDHRLVLKHWGEGNTALARKETKARLCKSTFKDRISTEFAIVDFEFAPGPATLVNLNVTPAGAGQVISIAGQIEPDHLPKVTGPRAVFKPKASDIRTLLTEYASHGGSHHLTLVKNNGVNVLEKMGKLLGWSHIKL